MKRIFHPQDPLTLMLADVCRAAPVTMIPLISRVAGEIIYRFRGGRRREALGLFKRLCEVVKLEQTPEELTRMFFQRKLMESVAGSRMLGASAHDWSLVQSEHFEKVQTLLDEGRGLVLTSVHFGTMMLTSTRLLGAGRQVYMVRPDSMKDVKSKRAQRMLFNGCEVIFLPMSGTAMAAPLRTAVKALKAGAVVGMAIDGEVGDAVLPIPLFGREFPVRPGAQRLAELSGAPMVFGYGAIDNWRYHLKYGPVAKPGPNGYTEEQFTKFWAECGLLLEEAISWYPASMWWSRPMRQTFGLKGE